MQQGKNCQILSRSHFFPRKKIQDFLGAGYFKWFGRFRTYFNHKILNNYHIIYEKPLLLSNTSGIQINKKICLIDFGVLNCGFGMQRLDFVR